MFKVFGALVALTIITALTAQIDIGAMNVPLALAIAGTKAALVVMFFMALKYDSPVNTLVFAMGGIFVLVFLVFTLFDTMFRGDLGNVGTETISDIERMESVMRDREADLQGLPTQPPGVEGGADTTAADTTAADTTAVNATGADTSAAGAGTPADTAAAGGGQ